MKIKKIVGALLAIMTICGVCACKNTDASSNNSTSSESSSESSSGDVNSGSNDGGNESDSMRTAIELTRNFNGDSVELLSPEIQMYLDAKTPQEALQTLEAYAGSNGGAESVRIEWKGNGSVAYTVELADNAEFVQAKQILVSGYTPYLDLTNLYPSTTYYWRVCGTKPSDDSMVGSFVTSSYGVRYITAEGGANIRDLGGWTNENGQFVRYGLLYRGNCLNGYNGGAKLTEEGKATFVDDLGMYTEIDLRTGNVDDAGQKENFFNAEYPYVKATLGQYTQIFQGSAVAPLQTIFSKLAQKENYPIYVHCNAGADRTGTLSFLVNGLLGVEYEQLVKDFELTSFSSISGKRYRSAINAEGTDFDETGIYKNVETHGNYVAFDLMYRQMLEMYGTEGGTLSQAIENYLLNFVGISDNTLIAIKEILLEGYESPTANDIILEGEPQRILLTDTKCAISLQDAQYESVQSISIGNKSLGTDLSALDFSDLTDVFGDVIVRVVVNQADGTTQAYQVPVLIVTKEISAWDDFIATIQTNHETALYGYYVLTEDLSYDNGANLLNPNMEEWWVESGLVGFRGTLDGQGHSLTYNSTSYGLFSKIGLGAVIKNIKINDLHYGGNHETMFAVSCVGATFENVEISMLDGGSDTIGDFNGWLVSAYCHNTIFKNVTILAEGKQIGSLLGGRTERGYDFSKPCSFEDVQLRVGGLKELSHLRTDSTGGVLQSVNFYNVEGIGGTVGEVSQEENTIQLSNKTSWLSIDSRFGVGATVKEINFGEQAVSFSAVNDMYIFQTADVFGLADVGKQILHLKVEANQFEIILQLPVLVDSGFEKIILADRQDVLLTENVNGIDIAEYADYDIISIRYGTFDLGVDASALQLNEVKANPTLHGEQTLTVWAKKGDNGVELSVPITFITEQINDFKRLKEVCSIVDWNETKGLGTYYVLGSDFSASTDVGAYNGTASIGGAIWLSGGGLGCGFQGTLDGRGHSISDINFNNMGLFGALTNAVVKNISFTNATVEGNSSIFGANAQKSVIENVTITLRNSVVQTEGGILFAQQSKDMRYKNVSIVAAGSTFNTLIGSGQYAGDNTNIFENVIVQAGSLKFVGYTVTTMTGVIFKKI